ncbi:uncharacterized protein LOC130715311 [Lotus japonicus]|uniref:uncharacterized protein LOC130715311 n=1 Tax=Lotus japonicus TaxID=34305 RepID=UPI002587E626|nr:uncharacterized protein LOC130715311 [Lotus japonicus]
MRSMVTTKVLETIVRWEIVLSRPAEDQLWKTDGSGVRRVYVGDVELLGRNRSGTVVERQTLRGGAVVLPHSPARFHQTVVDEEEEDPSEDTIVESRLVEEEEAVEPSPPEAKSGVCAQRIPGRPKCFRVGPRKTVIKLEQSKKRARGAGADVLERDLD